MKKFKWSIDGCDEKGLKGWLMDADFPDSHIQMKVFIDGKFLCNASADIFRQDLLKAGLGNGQHGFYVPISDEFFDNREHVFAVGDALTGLLIDGAFKSILLLNKPYEFPITHPVGICDFAFLFNKHIVILTGYITRSYTQTSIKLLCNKTQFNLAENTSYYFRNDLLKLYPWSFSTALGFTSAISNETPISIKSELYLFLSSNNQRERLPIKLQELSWNALYDFIAKYRNIAKSLFKQLMPLLNSNEKNKLQQFLSHSYYDTFVTNYLSAQHTLMQENRILFAIDYAYALNTTGVLIFGWKIIINSKFTIYICDENNNKIDITNTFFSISRKDVFNSHNTRFPDMNEYCGFVCLIPLATKSDGLRMVVIDFGELGEYWVKIPFMNKNKKGIKLIKEILSIIPAVEQNRLFNLFDQVLGTAIESIAQNDRIDITNQLIVTQYGTPVKQPIVSIIVPLYGRYDFIRYQLSHFADDTDFKSVDLIYVIDDPNIITASNEYSAVYQPVFNIPFRTVSYNCNLGFAGANNVGASIATSDVLLLMNSDVLPKQHGWISILKSNLEILPDVGAVAPLLQYADDSIQHAGMVAQRNNRLPGFLFNIHPNKGQPWYKMDEPYQCAMLTGACLMLKKQDYLDVDGLDEGYVLGDFEDSDLCCTLRKRNKTLWLVPSAKLWHLERQSQNLNTVAGFRQLLTLYNGWRLQNKIRNDLIANPEIEIV